MLDSARSDREPDTAMPTVGRRPVRTDFVLLTAGGPFASIIANELVSRFGPFTIIEEEPEPAKLFRRRRRRMLGLSTVLGQRAFDLAQRVVWKLANARREEILRSERLDTSRPTACEVVRVPSVNSDECRTALRKLAPRVVLVIGTRIIRRPTLECIPAPFINYHAGINPKYRGICGGYWALASGDRENFGVTLHLVDPGVDTGPILCTANVAVTPRDNITTYPVLLASAARPLVIAALEDALRSRIETRHVDLPSYQWFHPTLWQYAWNGLTRGVW
jgi:folate-dependent phosphoribosylglycinamide formyltransferase PurN